MLLLLIIKRLYNFLWSPNTLEQALESAWNWEKIIENKIMSKTVTDAIKDRRLLGSIKMLN